MDAGTALVWLSAASLANAASQLVMRHGGRRAVATEARTWWAWLKASQWWLAGILLSWMTGLAWAWVLRTTPISWAMPLYVGLVYLLTILLSIGVLKECPRPVTFLGAMLVLAGIVLIAIPAST